MSESLLAGKGISFYRVLEAVPYQGVGDKIKLPPSCFTELSDQGAFDKGPLYFRLSAVQQGVSSSASDGEENLGITHSGVLEFTADEGAVGLPPEVWNNLFREDSAATPLVEVRYVWLPKGTYAKLQPDGMGFSDLPNHKAILETSLRQHATLSQNDILMVSYGDLSYKLRVLELKPSSSVSVLETDVEVDIVSPDSASGRVDEHALIPLKLGASESGVVDQGHYIYYKFSIEDDVFEKIASEEAVVEVKIEVEETSGGDTDLYVSKHPLIFPTQHQHEWSSHDVGSKSLILSSKHKGLGSGAFSIGVYGFRGTTKFHLSVQVHDNKKPQGQQVAASSSNMEIDTMECKNCKRQIPSRTIALHEAYCSRHNVICEHAGCGIVLRVEDAPKHVHCEKCGQALQKVEMEKHMKVFHEPLHCPCGAVLEKQLMVSLPFLILNCLLPIALVILSVLRTYMPESVNHPLLSEWMLLGKTTYRNLDFLGASYFVCSWVTTCCDNCEYFFLG